MPKFYNINCVSKVKDLSVSKFDKKFLIQYIEKSNSEIDNPKLYKIKSNIFYKVLNKKELDNMIEDCCEYIINYINSGNLIKEK